MGMKSLHERKDRKVAASPFPDRIKSTSEPEPVFHSLSVFGIGISEIDQHNTLKRLTGIERKSVNEKVRELMEEYVREHSMEPAMKDLWDEIGRSMKKKGYNAPDVEKTIRKARSAK